MNSTVVATEADASSRLLSGLQPLPGTLSRPTIQRLARHFAAKGHRPSDSMWEALTDLAVTLEDMALGVAQPKFFLSSLDPGVGKTQTITHFFDTHASVVSYLR